MGSPVDLTLGRNTEGHGRINGATLHYKNGFSAYPSVPENLESLEEQLRALKDERRKVEGFKRELPLCIELLEDGKVDGSIIITPFGPPCFACKWVESNLRCTRCSHSISHVYIHSYCECKRADSQEQKCADSTAAA